MKEIGQGTAYLESIGFPPLWLAGMGGGVSNTIAKEVGPLGVLPVFSTVGSRTTIIGKVKQGDETVIAIAKTFPIPQHVEELLAFAPREKWHNRAVPMDHLGPKGELARRLTTIATFIEVGLAKQGHRGPVGANIMYKLPGLVLPSTYGAMLAGIDLLVYGAGAPMEVPDFVHKIQTGENLYYSSLFSTGTSASLEVHPETPSFLENFDRPMLAPIFSSFLLSKRLVTSWQRSYDCVPDFIVLENHEGGGHNATSQNRETRTLSDEYDGIELYFESVRSLGIPVMVAGAGDHREDYLRWKQEGAYGLAIGSRYALCSSSGFTPEIRHRIIRGNREGTTKITTSYRHSPTDYPLKNAVLSGTLSDDEVYSSLPRGCKIGYLRHGHKYTDPTTGKEVEVLICPAMPLEQYMRLCPDKSEEQCRQECEGKRCMCPALLAAIGLIPNYPPYITLGKRGANVMKEETARQITEDILTPGCVAENETRLRIS